MCLCYPIVRPVMYSRTGLLRLYGREFETQMNAKNTRYDYYFGYD